MLDQTKTYAAFTRPYSGPNQSPQSRFKKIKILFEDDIGFYVESLTERDQRNLGKRFSIKKHCYILIAIDDKRRTLCAECPLYNEGLLEGRN